MYSPRAIQFKETSYIKKYALCIFKAFEFIMMSLTEHYRGEFEKGRSQFCILSSEKKQF